MARRSVEAARYYRDAPLTDGRLWLRRLGRERSHVRTSARDPASQRTGNALHVRWRSATSLRGHFDAQARAATADSARIPLPPRPRSGRCARCKLAHATRRHLPASNWCFAAPRRLVGLWPPRFARASKAWPLFFRNYSQPSLWFGMVAGCARRPERPCLRKRRGRASALSRPVAGSRDRSIRKELLVPARRVPEAFFRVTLA